MIEFGAGPFLPSPAPAAGFPVPRLHRGAAFPLRPQEFSEVKMTDVLAILAETQQGAALQTVNDRMNEAVEAVCNTQQPAKVVLTFTVAPRRVEMGGAVTQVDIDIAAEVKKKSPKPGGAIYFVDDRGNLSRDMPGQENMFTEEVTKK